MTASAPTKEPAAVTAGDSVFWNKSFSEYPASAGWALRYRLINAAGHFDFVATASGDDFAVSIPPATSATWPPGKYQFVAYVDGVGGARHTVGAGEITIKPNLAAHSGGYDNRSTARQTLDLLNAAMVDQGKNAWTTEYEIAGRRMKFLNPIDFVKYRFKVMAEVAREDAAARLAAGLPSKSRILVKF